MKQLKSIDALRAIAVFLVMIWHFLPHHYNERIGVIQQFLVPSGVSAVIFFFVLSGFLITGILLHDKEQSDNKLLVV
ncbi:MAG TPA: acyltransferase family protein, partial [Chitinophagaceae bacterium]|nr:acyltransferase family protein [Chitinophagaceae bacterium]